MSEPATPDSGEARARRGRRLRRGTLPVLAGLAIILASCGNNSGVGLFGDFNGRVRIETGDVQASQEAVRTVVERTHQGQLEKEDTQYPPRFLWIFGADPESVLTFRVPAEEFDATLVDLDNPAIGRVVTREITGRDNIERRSDLSEISSVLGDKVDSVIDRNSDQQVVEAQQKLDDLADEANRPVLVIVLAPGRDALGWLLDFTFSRGLWMVIALAIGYAFGRGRRKEQKQSPVLGPDDPRQNTPERSHAVHDTGSAT